VSEQVEERGRQQAPLLDLFATAVHRFGSAWADLVAATLVGLVLGTAPILIADAVGASTSGTFAVGLVAYTAAFYLLLGFVVLRGLPTSPPASRWVATAVTALIAGFLAGALVVMLLPFVVVVMPLLLLAVPSVAAGDAGVLGAIPRGVTLAVRNFSRVWGVWLLAIVFSLPIWISVALVTLSFSSGTTQTFITLAIAAPVIWPFCALFVRALYGDLTGRLVVAPQDRSR
jgi:hypothetical protein